MTGRVVAELGRAETPEETAQRKATSSRIYRSSQTFRNLIAALLATVVVVGALIFAVPRGDIPDAPAIDVDAVAQRLAAAEGRSLVTPDLPDTWRVNSAGLDNESLRAWSLVYVPDDAAGFVRITQAFDADPAWAARELSGASSDGQISLGGLAWTRYRIDDSAASGNITRALEAQAGADTVLVYGTADSEQMELAATSVADDVLTIRSETP